VSRLADIAPKLEKLILLLSSDQPGEVAAAAAAITRALKAIDADWHDLGRLLTTTPVAPLRDTDRNGDRSGWRPLHAYCKRHPDALNSREQDFMATLDRWRGNVTEKQLAWLIAIYHRLRRQETPG
jgi:hypothetical protein